jgi:hypothetical protein
MRIAKVVAVMRGRGPVMAMIPVRRVKTTAMTSMEQKVEKMT